MAAAVLASAGARLIFSGSITDQRGGQRVPGQRGAGCGDEHLGKADAERVASDIVALRAIVLTGQFYCRRQRRRSSGRGDVHQELRVARGLCQGASTVSAPDG